MTLAELKAEMKARNPAIQGISSKNKDWFLMELGIGTRLQSSNTGRSKPVVKSQKKAAKVKQEQEQPYPPVAVSSSSSYQPDRAYSRNLPDEYPDNAPSSSSYHEYVYSSEQKYSKQYDSEASVSEEYDSSNDKQECNEYNNGFGGGYGNDDYPSDESSNDSHGFRSQSSYPKAVRQPTAASKKESKKLQYTVWTSCGYDNDGWHSYHGPPEKEFNSSFRTLEQANERAEYVFYHDNPWGSDAGDIHDREAVTDEVDSKGYRFLECRPEDSERWTVSVVTSSIFDSRGFKREEEDSSSNDGYQNDYQMLL